MAALVCGAGLWLRHAGAFPFPFHLFVLATLGTALSSLPLITGWATKWGGRHFAWLLVALDSVLVTAIVTTSGGPRSLFTFLYVLTVMEGCFLLSRVGGLVVAGLSSLLYVGLVIGRTILPLSTLLEPSESTALEVFSVFLNAGVLLVSAIVAGSMAERYQMAQASLEAQQRHLSDVQAFRDLIFQSVGTGLIAVGPDGRITAFNRAAEAITGLPADAALGEPWRRVFGDDVDLERVRAAVGAREGQSQRYEIQLHRQDGRSVPVGISFWLLRSGEGDAIGLIGVCQDLSSIKQMEERMRQADRLAAIGRLSANIAHEIRNPLASVSGAIEVLARDIPPDPTRERLVEIVLSESARLNQLISDFLEYARPAPLAPIEVNASRVLDDVLVLLEHRRLPDNLKVVREYDERLLVRADPQQLRQAIWNLCLNAVQSMPEGGELRVTGRLLDGGGGPARVHIGIVDTGYGIAETDLPHIFEPFYSTKPEGSGLGLAMVYRVVQEHGGEIDVRSTVRGGTTFTLSLPAAAVAV
jgi:two-component system sensor histidine kinase PilS (NtrC family)